LIAGLYNYERGLGQSLLQEVYYTKSGKAETERLKQRGYKKTSASRKRTHTQPGESSSPSEAETQPEVTAQPRPLDTCLDFLRWTVHSPLLSLSDFNQVEHYLRDRTPEELNKAANYFHALNALFKRVCKGKNTARSRAVTKQRIQNTLLMVLGES
jgi:hypothetical protein